MSKSPKKTSDASAQSSVHASLIAYIREEAAAHYPKLRDKIEPKSDEQLYRLMFSNYRSAPAPQGLRLTAIGLTIMQTFFKGCEIEVPPDEKVLPTHLLHLDSTLKMPYYLSDRKIVVYEKTAALKLSLSGGRISTWVDIETRL